MSTAREKKWDDSKLVMRVSKLVSEFAGIHLGVRQIGMIRARLSKRMLDLGITDPEKYFDFLMHNQEAELPVVVSLITTHHTFFFREFSHFQFLEREALPKVIHSMRGRGEKKLRIWSAACSTGQEVYSLAMFLSVHLKLLAPEMSFEILGTDVDEKSVAHAKNGVYRWSEIKQIPAQYLGQHWARGTGEISEFVKAKSTLRNVSRFETINLTSLAAELKNEVFDIIFCRNVFIYFQKEQICEMTEQMVRHLHKDGYFIIGTSESLNGFSLPIQFISPSIYSHRKLAVVPRKEKGTTPVAKEEIIRVLCVDDSPTILTLLKHVLRKELGFEVVAIAKDGIDAALKLKQHKIDVMTLDIHMPVQNGLDYLARNFGASHIPVVMLSSVAREESNWGIRCLELGACDFIEKPSQANLEERGDEIRTKLRSAVWSKKPQAAENASVLKLSRSFQKTLTIQHAEKKLRVIVGTSGDVFKMRSILQSVSAPHPPTWVFILGAPSMLPGLRDKFSEIGWGEIELREGADGLEKGKIYLADFHQVFDKLLKKESTRQTATAVCGDLPIAVVNHVAKWPRSSIVLEDIGEGLGSQSYRKLRTMASSFVPYTSIGFHLDELLSKEK